MLVFLRLVGITNAAVWLGAVVFYSLGVAPALSSVEVSRILPSLYGEAVAHVVLERYFTLHCWCGGIALMHLLLECLYAGKPLRRGVLYLVLILWGWGLLGSFWLQPELRRLHLDRYGVRSTPAQRQRAVQPYRLWQSFFHASNVLANLGVLLYVLHVASPWTPPRFVRGSKFKG